MELRALCLIVLLAVLAVSSQAAKNKKGKKGASDCAEWKWGSCVPNKDDCGVGTREGTCKEETSKLKCKIPCNWKKSFGADCKYKFNGWQECNAETGMKRRVGNLKKALYNAECQKTVEATKPCSLKPKSKSKGKKGKSSD
ncbi:midkine [Hyperolius riggenbachi]|uniref:midkine n=1 Tax=Hyperolius riggenbachi TaxID=752182 RepID=UPI0035A365FE